MKWFNLFVLHGGPRKAEVDECAGETPRCGRLGWNGFHAQHILNECELLFGVVVQKGKIAHAPKAPVRRGVVQVIKMLHHSADGSIIKINGRVDFALVLQCAKMLAVR